MSRRFRFSIGFASAFIAITSQTVESQTLVNRALVGGSEARSGTRGALPRGYPRSVVAGGVGADAASENAATVTKWTTAERFSRTNEEEFRRALQLRNDDAALADRLVAAQEPAAVAAALAIVADDPASLAAEVATLSPPQAAIVNADARALRDRGRTVSGGRQVIVFADGNIRGALNDEGEEGEDGAAGTGSLGASVATPMGLWTAKVALASTETSVTNNFGTVVLAPGAGRSLASGLLDLRLDALPIHVYATASSSRWQFGEGVDVTTVNATVAGVGVLYFNDLAQGSVGETPIALSAEVGGALRLLDGDIRGREDREEVFGSDGTAFGGLEAGFALTFGRVTGAVQLYSLFDMGDPERRINGLTGLQIVAGLGVTGEMFRGRLGL